MGVVQGAVPSMEEGRQQNAGYLSASAAAERLQRNVQREHSLCTDFLLAFWQVPPRPGWRHDFDQGTGIGHQAWPGRVGLYNRDAVNNVLTCIFALICSQSAPDMQALRRRGGHTAEPGRVGL